MSTAAPARETGETLAMREWGDGPRRALLLHGLGSSGATWWRIGDALAERGFSVCAPDLRGHGRSPRAGSYRGADYAEDVIALGTGWDLVVGHSLGGAVAVEALDREPALAARLLLIDPVLALADADWALLARTHLDEVRHPPSAWAFARANPRWHPRDAQLKAQAVRQTTAGAVRRTLEHNRPWEFRPQAARLSCETLVLAGDVAAGGLLSPALARSLSADNPALVARTVQGAGHSIHRERPAVVVHAIDELFARTAA